MDPTSPPSSVYAAYNHDGSRAAGVDKQIQVYEFNEHEGDAGHQCERRAAVARRACRGHRFIRRAA
jgi:cephalosporin-C deacetylase